MRRRPLEPTRFSTNWVVRRRCPAESSWPAGDLQLDCDRTRREDSPIDKVIAPRASEIITNFLRVLTRHGRLDLLPAILREARIRNEIRQGRRRVRSDIGPPARSPGAKGASAVVWPNPFRSSLSSKHTSIRPYWRDRHPGRRHRLRQFARDAHRAAARAVNAEEPP